MSAVSEEVVTSDQAASTAPGATPETQASSSAPEGNGVAKAAEGVQPAPAPTASYSAPSTPSPESAGSNQSEFERAMFKELGEGDVVTGTVVHIDKDGVLVDVGAKSEGIIRPNELSREPYDNIEDVVKVGEDVKVVVIGRDREDGGVADWTAP